jgi:EAL domain-containing protein (putative c-di-GMP-specific phosphodiesterase class I)
VRRAIEDGRIVVEYQPIVDLKSGLPVGAEALVRICDLEYGLRLPASFLGVAEETGLLIAIDQFVLADALAQAAGWRARLEGTGFGGVAINLTARRLADSEFRQAVVDQLAFHGVPPCDLQVEVTERVLMEASNSAVTGLRDLRDLGVKVGLDDFGTGYSSLAYLRQFPLDFVKIDKSFVDDLVIDRRARAIVAAIIVLSHALDLTVVAEGVEFPSQRQVLLDLECDRAQGFLYSASGPPGDIDGLVLGSLASPQPL